jgi:tetratricopeptide (TPR) repeat protein
MGRYDEAEQILKTGLTIRGKDASIHLELGNLYVQIGKLRDAIGEFRQAMAIEPRNPEPVRALAVALMEDGRMVNAESVLRNAIRSLDELKVWQLHLALCQLLIKLADDTGDSELCDEALKEANKAMTLANQQSETHFCCGIARYKMDDYRGALQCFKKCQALDQTRVDAEINARRVKKLLHQEQKRSRLMASLALSGIILAQLVLLWWWRLRYGADDTEMTLRSAKARLTITSTSCSRPQNECSCPFLVSIRKPSKSPKRSKTKPATLP